MASGAESRRFLVGRVIAGLLLVSSSLVPSLAGATTKNSLPACTPSRLTFALGSTQRYTATRSIRGGLTSITRIRVTNAGPTCRFGSSVSLRFDFSPYDATPGLFSAAATAKSGASEVLTAGERTSLVAYVRDVSSARDGYCEPRTAQGVALIIGARGGGYSRYLFPRRISSVCSNPASAASNFGVVWQDRWIL
ncbi:MAG: hypothetical protein ACYC5Z_05720 [Acidimicrobiales bacterium]